ncbi:hypothetical protein ABZ806_04415 [Spirillospora sp. NPDC047418]
MSRRVPRRDPGGACAAVTEPMGEPMAASDELPRVRRGPLYSLYAALRRRAPQVSVTPPDESALRVAYRGRTATVVWDGDLGQYASQAGEQLGPDAEKAAELVAWGLDAPATSPSDG